MPRVPVNAPPNTLGGCSGKNALRRATDARRSIIRARPETTLRERRPARDARFRLAPPLRAGGPVRIVCLRAARIALFPPRSADGDCRVGGPETAGRPDPPRFPLVLRGGSGFLAQRRVRTGRPPPDRPRTGHFGAACVGSAPGARLTPSGETSRVANALSRAAIAGSRSITNLVNPVRSGRKQR